jgi:hypothetical protein
MSRYLLFVLLLATGVAVADDKPGAQYATDAAEAQAKTETAKGKTEAAQKKADAAQGKADAAQGETEHAQAKTDEAHPQTEEAPPQTDEDAKLTSVRGAKALGMSILGNQDAPKSLTIVPWKSSELGESLGISTMLDDSKQPVDKEVFMRALRYYEIRSKTKP